MEKIYNIYFRITNAYGEWIYNAHYTRKRKNDANRFLKKLAEKSKASSLVKSDEFGLSYFKVTEPDFGYISQGHITVEEVKAKKKSTKSKKAKK